MEKHILTDADGVLVLWVDAFNQFMKDSGFRRMPDTEKEYSMALRYDLHPSTAEMYIKAFNESDRIASLPAFADAPKYIQKLVEKGFRFTVVTSLSDNPESKIHREKNLRDIYGDIFDEVVCIKMGASKYETLKRWYGTKFFWIEDHQRQAEAGYEVGLRPILINQPYNAHYSTDLFPSVSYDTPWKEIYEIVCKDYKLPL